MLTAGAFNWNRPTTEKFFDLNLRRARDPHYAEAETEFRKSTADLKEQILSAQLLNQFESNIEVLQDISERVLLIQMPFNPKVGVTPQTQSRVRRQLIEMANRRQLTVHFLADEIQFQQDDYLDSTHLLGPGVVKLNSVLADQINQALTPKP